MCVVAAKPAGVNWLPAKNMKNCFSGNPDGAGMAWVEEGKLRVEKGYFRWKTLYHDLKVLERFSVLLHCRLATHGTVRKENCHPFLLENGVAMAHNGIIDINPIKKDMTDSETFGREYVEKFSVENLEAPHVKGLIEAAIGGSNKIAMLKKDGEFIILNRGAGVVQDGIWFSNRSYENRYNPNSWKYPGYLEDYDELYSCYNGKPPGVKDDDIGGLRIEDAYEDISDPFYASDKYTGLIEKINLSVVAKKVN